MWRPRDRERYIGGYDPEHEMPDPDREPGDRWQSGAYRHNARDTRFAYRMNPDAVERHYEGDRGYNRDLDWRDARDMNRDYDYDRGGYGGGNYDRGGYGGGNYDRGGYNGQDRGGYGGGGYRGGGDFNRDFNRGGNYGGGNYGGGGYGGGGRDWDRGPFGGADRGRGEFDRGGYGGDHGYRNDGPMSGPTSGATSGPMSGPHFDRFSSDRGRDHQRWNSGGRGTGYDDFRDDDWRRRR